MCEGAKTCQKCRARKAAAELLVNKAKRQKIGDVVYVVVPVIMAKQDVVMNDALLPAEEYDTVAWNGTVVTVTHPSTADGGFLSAKDLEVQEKFGVGVLQNVKVVENSLRGEIWIDAEKAEKVRPGLVVALERGQSINVSTGYFCDSEVGSGQVKGKQFKEVHRNLVPDHLALLPDELGACSVDDGCGTRNNSKRKAMDKKQVLNFLAELLGETPAPVKNAEDPAKADPKKEDVPAEVNADVLIGMAGSPFGPNDKDCLSKMSAEAMKKCADMITKAAAKVDMPTDKTPVEPAANAKKKEVISVPVKNAESVLNADDKAALAHARKAYADHRASLIGKIVANSNMKAEALEKFDTATLETVAAGLRTASAVPASYFGRAAPEAGGAEDPHAADMDSGGVLAFHQSRKAKKEAA